MDQYAELRQAIVALKQKYPELFCRQPTFIPYMEQDGVITVSHINRPDMPIGIVVNADESTQLATIQIYP